MPRPYTLTSVKPLKGLRTNVDRHSLEIGQFSSLINFNTNRAGYIEKRKGLVRNGTAKPAASTTSRVMLISRSVNFGFSQPIMWACDANLLYRTSLGVITNPSWTAIPAFTGQMEWIFEYGAVTAPYIIQGCRRNGQTFSITPSTNAVTLGAGPEGTFCIPYKNRMWVINTAPASLGLESRLYFSDNSSFAIWTGANAGFIDLEPGDGQALVCAIVYNDILYIFKTRSVWVLDASPDDPADWTPRKIHDAMGCAGRGTPTLVEGFLYFYSGEGIYRTDGTTFEEISEPIRDKFTGFDYKDRERILLTDAVYYDNKYIFNRGDTNHFLVFDVVSETWSQWLFAMATTSSFRGLQAYGDDGSDYLFCGSSGGAANGGHVYRMNTHTEWYQDDTAELVAGGNANNYTATAQLGGMDNDLPGEYKRNFYTALDAKGSSTAEIQCIDASRIVTSEYTKRLPDSERRFVRFPGVGRFRSKQTNMLHSVPLGEVGGPLKIFSVNYADETRDRAHRLTGSGV